MEIGILLYLVAYLGIGAAIVYIIIILTKISITLEGIKDKIDKNSD
ncbi:hypothetical protein [Lactococcus sp. dk322]|nr:hypothetical protein [Lactococcus sp. dk322]